MNMNNNTKYVILAVLSLAVVVAAIAVFLNEEDVTKYATDMDNSELKVYGNINGDGYIDGKDIEIVEKLIGDGATAEDYPLADANQDKVLDSKDIDLIRKMANGEECMIWHINFHDTNKDGVMDYELVSTKMPIRSILVSDSSKTFMTLYLNGIVDEVKGATYFSVDPLFKDTYGNTNKVEKIDLSTFENGKVGASNIIVEKNITAILADWNQGDVSNEQEYEDAGIDVIRIAAGETDIGIIAHNCYLLNLLFQKGNERAGDLVEFTKSVYQRIDDVVSEQSAKPRAVASSMTNMFSVGGSDYNKILEKVGAVPALNDGSFGSVTSVRVLEQLSVFNTQLYQYDYVIHQRTFYAYTGEADVESIFSNYSKTIAEYWEHELDGQYLVCTNVPIPVILAYVAAIFYDDLSMDWANGIHQEYVDRFFLEEDKVVVKDLLFVYPEP